MSPVRRVCVIGAGTSGLVAIKTSLEEGLEPVCMEKSDRLGGVWAYRDKPIPDQTEGQLYECLVTNSSKLMMNFSDYPFPRSVPPYIPGREVNQYFEKYADHFDLRRHIRFNTEVSKVEPAEDYAESGKWFITSRQEDGKIVDEVYDAVMLCTGFFAKCHLPIYVGQDRFQGQILHSNEFRKGRDFENKTVLVVGGSHSAGDVAVDCSYHAKQVYLSMRHGAWVLTRNAGNGVPRDMLVNSRFQCMVPMPIKRWLTKRQLDRQMNFYNLGLHQTKELFHSEVMVNDVIGVQIFCGTIKAKCSIERFTPNGVVFTDGTTVEGLDAVVFATGYELSVPFIDTTIIGETFKDLELFWHVFPPRLEHPTFAAIGFFETIGSHAPVMELQARWACRVFRGLCKLPSNQTMITETRESKRAFAEKFGKHKTFFPPIPYSDRVAGLIGAKPSVLRLALTDPLLAIKYFFGPAFPYAYRLQGPHPWRGARDAILRGWDDTVLATKTRTSRSSGNLFSGQYSAGVLLILFCLFVIFYVIALIFASRS